MSDGSDVDQEAGHRELVKATLERDSYLCLSCGQPGSAVRKRARGMPSDIGNMVTLCDCCTVLAESYDPGMRARGLRLWPGEDPADRPVHVHAGPGYHEIRWLLLDGTTRRQDILVRERDLV